MIYYNEHKLNYEANFRNIYINLYIVHYNI